MNILLIIWVVLTIAGGLILSIGLLVWAMKDAAGRGAAADALGVRPRDLKWDGLRQRWALK